MNLPQPERRLNSPDTFGRKEILAAVCTAFLLFAAFPPAPFIFFAYFAFVPLLRSVMTASPARAALVGYVAGLFFNLLILFWILPFNWRGYWIIALLNPWPFVVTAYTISLLKQHNPKIAIWLFPFLWAALEYIREFGKLAFTWGNLAYSQTAVLPALSLASFGGTVLIVFWVALLNVLVYQLLNAEKYDRKKYMIGISAVLCLVFGFGFIHNSQPDGSTKLNISIVQPNIESQIKWKAEQLKTSERKLFSQTMNIYGTKSDLIVWPETAIPYSLHPDSTGWKTAMAVLRNKNAPLITGAMYTDTSNLRYNSAFLFDPESRKVRIYKKRLLVPEEEGNPYPFAVNDEPNSKYLSSGSTPAVLKFHTSDSSVVFAGMAICYESLFSRLMYQSVEEGADLFCVITNDEWFDKTPQPYQHFLISRLRAIEFGRPVIQCANSGTSGVIDANGNILQASDIGIEKVIEQDLSMPRGNTLYYRAGFVIGPLMILISFIAMVILIFSRIRMKNKVNSAKSFKSV